MSPELLPTSLVGIYGMVFARLLPLTLLVSGSFGMALPRRWVTVVACYLTALLGPQQSRGQLTLPDTGYGWIVLARQELLVGLALGMGFAILLAGFGIAGPLIAQVVGIRGNEGEAEGGRLGGNVVERYSMLLALSVFWGSGGQRQLVGSLLDSYARLPLGSLLTGVEPVKLLGLLLVQTFQVGILAAAPVVFCLLVATLVLALLARGMPFLGAFGLGVTVNLVVFLLVSSLAVQAVARTYQQQWNLGVRTVTELIVGGGEE